MLNRLIIDPKLSTRAKPEPKADDLDIHLLES